MDHDTADAYETLLSVAEFDSAVLDLVRAISAGVDADDLLERWENEHITNGAGRIEARVYEDEPGVWIADPNVGFAEPQKFATETEARAWVRQGKHYERPVDKSIN